MKKELVRNKEDGVSRRATRIGNGEKSEAHGKIPKRQVDQRIKRSNIRNLPLTHNGNIS